MQIMAIAIIPVAVSVHTIVSFDFSMAPVPMWQSTIFGPYFVAGGIFSRIAALLIAIGVLRRGLPPPGFTAPPRLPEHGESVVPLSGLLWGLVVFQYPRSDYH